MIRPKDVFFRAAQKRRTEINKDFCSFTREKEKRWPKKRAKIIISRAEAFFILVQTAPLFSICFFGEKCLEQILKHTLPIFYSVWELKKLHSRLWLKTMQRNLSFVHHMWCCLSVPQRAEKEKERAGRQSGANGLIIVDRRREKKHFQRQSLLQPFTRLGRGDSTRLTDRNFSLFPSLSPSAIRFSTRLENWSEEEQEIYFRIRPTEFLFPFFLSPEFLFTRGKYSAATNRLEHDQSVFRGLLLKRDISKSHCGLMRDMQKAFSAEKASKKT